MYKKSIFYSAGVHRPLRAIFNPYMYSGSHETGGGEKVLRLFPSLYIQITGLPRGASKLHFKSDLLINSPWHQFAVFVQKVCS